MHYITEISEVDILPEENEPLKLKEESIFKSNWTGCLQTVVFFLKVFIISATFAFQVCILTFKILLLTAWDSISDFLIAYKHLR